jgi:polysaccharide biosynthesis transport protein
MQSENETSRGRISTSRAVRHHPVVAIVGLVVGALLGLLYASSLPATYTSTATVLVNPSVGNPFVPTPSAVRQDELTSLETEAQVARSAEVLGAVTAQYSTVRLSALEKNLQIIVPPNSQTLAISYSAGDPAKAQLIANAVANAYLANRADRFSQVNGAQIKRLSAQTTQVVSDLRAATFAAQKGGPAKRAFQTQLATALRNELVSLRAQRTVLENSDVPAGSLISPAVLPHAGTNLSALIAPVGGTFLGLALGCLVAVLMEVLAGSIRAPREVEELGLPVAASVPTSRRPALLRAHDAEAFDTTVRRLRAAILDLDPRPDIITVAPPGNGPSEADVSEAVAESFAKAGHRVVLVRADDRSGDTHGLVVEDGLAQALLYERLNVMELLEPSREPLLCVLPAGGFDAQSREFLTSARLRSVLSPLVEAGNIVVIDSRGLGTVEGEAMAGAADLCLVTVTTRRTRTVAVAALVQQVAAKGSPVAALVVGRRDAARRTRLGPVEEGSGKAQKEKKTPAALRSRLTRTKR